MPTAKPTAPRRRNRKRKRRQASSSSSSDSSDSSSDEAEVSKKTPASLIKPQAAASLAKGSSSPSPSLSSSSSPSSSDSEESNDDVPHVVDAPAIHPASSSAIPQRSDSEPAKTRERRRSSPSPSPSPPPADAPPFLPPEGTSSRAQDEQALRNRFRQFWMASVADAFADDLEQIRQEPNMTKSRLAILIDSLASGGEIFSSYAGENGGLNEMDVVLNSDRGV